MRKDYILQKNAIKYGLILSLLGSAFATIKSILSFSSTLAYMLPLVLTILLSFYYYLYQKNVNPTLITFLTLATIVIELLLKQQLTDAGLGMFFWIYMFPIAIFTLFSPLQSLVLNITLITIFILLLPKDLGEINKDYFLFPLTFSYLTITFFNFLYKRFQDKQTLEIEEKTKSLNALNQTLSLRIDAAVKESKEKDKLLQQQAKLAQMGELLSMISHQWRQPLGSISAVNISIKSKLGLEKFDFNNKEQREEFLTFLSQKLDRIENYTSSLSATIDDFKNFYNPNKALIKSDVIQSVKKALDIMKGTLDRDQVTVDEYYQDNYFISHYPNELMQVILNLLNNAHGNLMEKKIKNPRISLSVIEQNDAIMIEISDNGEGIKEEILDKIFEPYFSTKRDKNGTGLGLYMSKTIIEEHHKGTLTVSNKNGGAYFTIMLPKSQNNSPLYDAPPAQK